MRMAMQLFFAVVLIVGLGGAAQAASFDLQFAAPGADCATDQAIDCNSADIIEVDGDLHFDIGDGVELIVGAFTTISIEGDWIAGTAIQDYPGMGGLAVLSNTDQVEAGEGLLFFQSDESAFDIASISFFDNHQLPNPETLVQVFAFVGDTLVVDDLYSIGELEDGALSELGEATHWVFQGVEGEETWYIGSMSSVPEPGTALLLGLGLTAVATRRKVRNPNAQTASSV